MNGKDVGKGKPDLEMLLKSKKDDENDWELVWIGNKKRKEHMSGIIINNLPSLFIFYPPAYNMFNNMPSTVRIGAFNIFFLQRTQRVQIKVIEPLLQK